MVDQPEINGRRAVRPALITAIAFALMLASSGAFAQTGNVDDKAQELQRQLQATRDLLQAKGMEPTVRELATRIESVEKAVALAHDDLVRVPTNVDKAIGGLKEFLDERISANDRVGFEKFRGIAVQFTERDERAAQLVVQQKDAADKLAKASADNIAAALLAQKDTADKSEKSILISLAEQKTLLQADIGALNGTINDLKSRIDRGEGQSKGTSDVWGYIVGVGGLILALVALMFSVFNSPTARPSTFV